ncbi:MAG: hypothetical protein N4A50_02070 [Vallitalea sp.]|jgi:hypothetical protein|nr:hypothetical protein [Vallitalea sp.]
MWKKSIKIFFVSILFILFIPMIACASPAEDKEDIAQQSFFEYFNLEQQDFLKKEKSIEPVYIDLNIDNVSNQNEDVEIYREDINEFTYLYLNEGFDKKLVDGEGYKVHTSNEIIDVVPTFSSVKNISGTGDEGIIVGILVYNYTEDNELNITYQSEYLTVGPSMIFNESIELNTVGVNNIIIAVMKDSEVECRRYVINRKEEQTKEKLENIEVEFIPEEQKKLTQPEETFDLLQIIEDSQEQNTLIKQK